VGIPWVLIIDVSVKLHILEKDERKNNPSKKIKKKNSFEIDEVTIYKISLQYYLLL